ncbi:MAG: hypothetical protein PHO02_03120 [Candidatus Nanoarchaeia archaeon]|nr:hypothetical protein [Candidatus Nanoarchaeia archaeon]
MTKRGTKRSDCLFRLVQAIEKNLYSQLDYIFVAITASLVFFRRIVPSRHYLEEHLKDVPWDKVVEIIFATKNPRKKGSKFEIESNGYYVLFEAKKGIIYVINAKKE